MKNIPLFSSYKPLVVLAALTLFILSAGNCFAQAEVEPWGDITGIRKSGQLFGFESMIKVQQGDHWNSTAGQRQHTHYKRSGDDQVVNTNIDSLFIKEIFTGESAGKVKVSVTLNAHSDCNFDNVFFTLQLPIGNYDRVKLFGVKGEMKHFTPTGINYDGTAEGARFKSGTNDLTIKFEQPETIRLRKDVSATNDIQLYVSLKSGSMPKGDSVQTSFTIDASGKIDSKTVELVINTDQQGRSFDGMGGNFRLQKPKFDPEVIDYCLQNLRVAFGRVEMPWRFWQPDLNTDPTVAADAGNLHPAVKNAMNMARRLDSAGAPFVLSAWFPPAWAAIGSLNYKPVNGVWGNQLNPDNMQAVYKSIADYILYMKKNYGCEPRYFSFNESDLGINVRMTAQQHDDFIKGCGAYFAANGVNTKMLLGDNSNATTYKFIAVALNDAEARPYIGAVAFHSWSGWDTGTLQHWADAANRLDLPLLVTEGSIDAAAWEYPDIFQEPAYALKEINLYLRLLAICQPESILQWQLTADYSPLIGGGIFGNHDQLHPGQRFWNLKQLSATPKGLFFMPVKSESTRITAAALGDNSKKNYTIHLVNNGAKRKVVLTGLPAGLKQLQIYVTSPDLNMKDQGAVGIKKGKAKFKIEATSFTTLIAQ